jgi:alpha-N-acetylglucosamine transferase
MTAVFAQRRIIAIAAAFVAICLILVSSHQYYYSLPGHRDTSPYANGHVTVVDVPFESKHEIPSPPAAVDTNKNSDENHLEHTPDGLDNHKPADKPANKPAEKPAGNDGKTPVEVAPVISPEHGNPNNTGTHPDGSEKLAYVTFLSGTLDHDEDLENDNYFIAIRILIWQLLHQPETRTNGIDVVVMVTPSVSQSRRDRLQRDGAILYPVEFLRSKSRWAKAEDPRWEDVMTKLRVWEMTQYSRILVMDGDSMLVRPLDGVFDDPAAQIQKTNVDVPYKPLKGEAPMPAHYLLASLSEVWDSTHDFPPTHGTGLKQKGFLNAGFFLLAPSIAAFNHYSSFLEIPKSFDPKYPEQNLMNQIHNWDGPMPWKELSYTWNIRCPSDNDIDKGLVSLHEKWWTQPYLYENARTKAWLLSRRWEMKGFFDAYDRFGPNAKKQA